MRTYVLIGGIGSGKSTVANMLRDRGASCIDLDLVGHEILESRDAISELVAAFGEKVLAADGSIDRKALAREAFATPQATSTLNSITQPRIVVRALDMLQELEEQGCPIAIVEISPFEGPDGVFAPIVNVSKGIVAVTAPTEARISRAVARGFAESDVRNRIERQATDEQRASWADIVLENAGTVGDLQCSVDDAWSHMTAGKGEC